MNELSHIYIAEARHGKLLTFLGAFCLTLILLIAFTLGNQIQNTKTQAESQVSGMVDELGLLRNENLALSNQLGAQVSVLKSIENDFSQLQKLLESQQGGEKYAGLFDDLSQEFAAIEAMKANQDTTLSSVSTDSTLDILILGRNGSHTDTIMIASINKAKEKVTLTSIPRDLYINGRRINAYYSLYGESQLRRMVEAVSGLKIDHFVELDFEGFIRIVDLIGGLDIYVDKAIEDASYPNWQGGYDPYSIGVGHHHMDGDAALRFARSRKSTSDFDRSARQQKIVSAVGNKIKNMAGEKEMGELTQLIKTGMQYVQSDLNPVQLLGFYYDFQDFEVKTGLVLSSGNHLYSSINQNGAYMLLPNTGNFVEIQMKIHELVN